VAQLFSLGILAPPFMNSKQLANVLIKILGLSVIVHSIPGILGSLFMMMHSAGQMTATSFGRPSSAPDSSLFIASNVVTIFVGALLIAKSRAIAGLLFGAEDE
jgi:hypothetical protein